MRSPFFKKNAKFKLHFNNAKKKVEKDFVFEIIASKFDALNCLY